MKDLLRQPDGTTKALDWWDEHHPRRPIPEGPAVSAREMRHRQWLSIRTQILTVAEWLAANRIPAQELPALEQSVDALLDALARHGLVGADLRRSA